MTDDFISKEEKHIGVRRDGTCKPFKRRKLYYGKRESFKRFLGFLGQTKVRNYVFFHFALLYKKSREYPETFFDLIRKFNQFARVTLPERRHLEQTLTVVGVPFTTALTLRMLGFQVLLVLRLEWETLCPKVTPLPQMLHLAILTPPETMTNSPIYLNFLF
jgi:hypothetical protein